MERIGDEVQRILGGETGAVWYVVGRYGRFRDVWCRAGNLGAGQCKKRKSEIWKTRDVTAGAIWNYWMRIRAGGWIDSSAVSRNCLGYLGYLIGFGLCILLIFPLICMVGLMAVTVLTMMLKLGHDWNGRVGTIA